MASDGNSGVESDARLLEDGGAPIESRMEAHHRLLPLWQSIYGKLKSCANGQGAEPLTPAERVLYGWIAKIADPELIGAGGGEEEGGKRRLRAADDVTIVSGPAEHVIHCLARGRYTPRPGISLAVWVKLVVKRRPRRRPKEVPEADLDEGKNLEDAQPLERARVDTRVLRDRAERLASIAANLSEQCSSRRSVDYGALLLLLVRYESLRKMTRQSRRMPIAERLDTIEQILPWPPKAGDMRIAPELPPIADVWAAFRNDLLQNPVGLQDMLPVLLKAQGSGKVAADRWYQWRKRSIQALRALQPPCPDMLDVVDDLVRFLDGEQEES